MEVGLVVAAADKHKDGDTAYTCDKSENGANKFPGAIPRERHYVMCILPAH